MCEESNKQFAVLYDFHLYQTFFYCELISIYIYTKPKKKQNAKSGMQLILQEKSKKIWDP